MIKLIVGLGNPGSNYELTRHNAGFLFLDRLAQDFSCMWSKSVQFQGLIAECRIGLNKVFLLKPQTFMNRSGQSVGQMVRYYKLMPEELLVVHDELDFPPGVLRLKKNGGHGGHNGLRDIIAHLGSTDFFRLRIGINRPSSKSIVADYVLSEPSQADAAAIDAAIIKGKNNIEKIISGDMALAMNELNSQE